METKAANKAYSWFPASVLVVYAALLIIVMAFHEPWFDEAQSWLIARDATLHDMLFTIPHYEGHPPLWWLILAIPAKLGVPYELGLKSVQAIFAVLAVYLILYDSPFPLWFRALLPFTYFVFFQYGVLSRPYSLMLCAICLCAITWKKRNERPFRFVLSLMLLCLTSAYGILIAGGIASAWSVEILKTKSLFQNKRRIIALLLLLAIAIMLLLMIWPKEDTFATRLYYNKEINSLIQRFLLFFLCLPAETTVTTYSNDTIINVFCPNTMSVVWMVLVSCGIWISLFIVSRNKKTILYLLFPYTLITVFGSIKYYALHHIGVLWFLFLFLGWISLETDKKISAAQPLKIAVRGLAILGIVCSISWTVFASYSDISSPFSVGRELSSYIADNNLEQYNWTSLWMEDLDDDSKLVYEDVHLLSGSVVETNPYMKKPLTGIQAGGTSYMDHKLLTPEESEHEIDTLKERGTDILIGVPLSGDYLDRLGIEDKLELLTTLKCNRIWKNSHTFFDVFIVAKKEIKELIDEK